VDLIEDTTASYVRVDDKAMFPLLALRDWVIVSGPFAVGDFGDKGERKLPYIAASSFGPPERAYGHAETTSYGLGLMPPAEDGEGESGYVAWQVGQLYLDHGFADHKHIIEGTIDRLLRGERTLIAQAHPSVEVTMHRLPDDAYMIHLLNLSGSNGVTYESPVAMRDIRLRLTGLKEFREAEALGDSAAAELRYEGKTVELVVKELGAFAAYRLS
ncbi:MAG: family 10 glycosylhydrolase, partial [Paenibacillus sp.]|nr:family 10 glycosylhydrolase [Paenibacillus sp.]